MKTKQTYKQRLFLVCQLAGNQNKRKTSEARQQISTNKPLIY